MKIEKFLKRRNELKGSQGIKISIKKLLVIEYDRGERILYYLLYNDVFNSYQLLNICYYVIC